ncbi:hypothetical protein PPYR_11897 [Photinus pyralis]|uniref:Antistasin-like domain-containing protein n=1 Tax=Photinus pyralis TaxID=7054 RepID=A0A5N4ACT1_PHOPY|nr:hypothetical protein PPYR_11897 [Photinus pyralis]
MMLVKFLYLVYLVVPLGIVRCGSDKIIKPILACRLCDPSPLCLYGEDFDQYGCPTCNCSDPCKGHICLENEVCIIEDLICTNPPCGIKPKCVCNLRCPYGYETECSGCQVCKCKHPCRDIVCPSGQYCAVEFTNCTKISCFPTPVCEYMI